MAKYSNEEGTLYTDFSEEELELYKKQRAQFGKKYFNYNSYTDVKSSLEDEDSKFYEDYKKVTGKNYDKEKAWNLLQKRQKKELNLIKLAKSGDCKARNYLFTKHLPAIVGILQKNFSTVFEPIEFNDRLHDCFFLFIEILDSYNSKKNNDLLRFLKLVLPRKMVSLLRKDSKHKDPKRGYKHEPIEKYYDSKMYDINPSLKVPDAFKHYDKEFEFAG